MLSSQIVTGEESLERHAYSLARFSQFIPSAVGPPPGTAETALPVSSRSGSVVRIFGGSEPQI